MNIAQWIDSHAQHTPEKTAIHFEGENISYVELSRRVGQSAALMTERWGLRHGDRVAVLAANHPEQVVVLFACAQIGAIFVPLNWRLAEPELQHILNDCEPTVLLHDRHYESLAQSLVASLSARCTAVPIESQGSLAEQRLGVLPQKLTRPSSFADSDLLIVYTSGTTGSPKGAVLGQGALRCNARMAQHAYDMRSTDVILNFLPLFHVGGMNIQMTPALACGATVVLKPKFDPADVLHAIERHQVSLTNSVPTILQALVEHEMWSQIDKRSLRVVSIGSTDVPTQLIEAVHASGIPVIQIYGATETSPIAMYQRPEMAYETVGAIGYAGLGCSVRLVDETGQDVAVEEHGEIWVSGENVLQRYWNNPEATDLALVDGWFRTGDVARRDARGLFWFSDRLKHVVISGGENIYPAEIERLLRVQPGVREVAVVGHAHPRWGEVPVAVVVREDASITEQSLLACFEGELARFKHPRHVIFCEALPRNAMAKVILADVQQLVMAELDKLR
ncbi:MAG: class I adenylate-forming enzyme family protein [Granulosicoccaceae bacterium]